MEYVTTSGLVFHRSYPRDLLLPHFELATVVARTKPLVRCDTLGAVVMQLSSPLPSYKLANAALLLTSYPQCLLSSPQQSLLDQTGQGKGRVALGTSLFRLVYLLPLQFYLRHTVKHLDNEYGLHRFLNKL